MKKKIAIMLTLILAAGTFTACAAEEKLNNDIQTSVVSKAADVSESTETSATATTEITIPKKPQFQKKQSLRDRIPKPKKKPTVGKIRRLFRQRIQFRKHNPKLRTTAGIQ